MTVSEALLEIVDITKKNLSLLEMINNSFYTKANHLSTTVGGASYIIPSYISLENKVNHLQDSFNNLVNAAQSGAAWINFDGGSKVINVAGYQQAPSPINLPLVKEFYTENTTLFKDMVTPKPYLNFDLGNLADDITRINVKKVIPYNEKLKKSFQVFINQTEGEEYNENAASHKMLWSNVVTLLQSGDPSYVKGVDYDDYEVMYELPVRHNTKSGTFIIQEILSDTINENLDEIINVKIHKDTPLQLTDFDGGYKVDLSACGKNGMGVMLTTFDGSAKLEIIELNPSKQEMVLRVVNGEYVNLVAVGEPKIESGQRLIDVASDYSKLRFYEDITDTRELHIALEEDQYVFIAVAPINSRINIQTTWGEGLFLNTYQLQNENKKFDQYYIENVTNIGDALNELTNIMYPSLTKYAGEYTDALTAEPYFSSDTVEVVQINKHLNDSESIKTIRSLYSQKSSMKINLEEVQNQINNITSELSQISFDDLSGARSTYEAQLTELKKQQNELNTSLSKVCDSIAKSANDSTIPLENGKYRIRGYVDVENYINVNFPNVKSSEVLNMMRGIQVMYRYKNPESPQANVSVIKDFLFTEWNIYEPPTRPRSMRYANGRYDVFYQDLTTKETDVNSEPEEVLNVSANIPKFNQIDIPINQGEIVEMKVRILWGFGTPYVTVATPWSESLEIEFPVELASDVQVTTIIEENNSDIETNRFKTIMSNEGVTEHVNAYIQDQDIKYFHKPDDIASGFYTSERRVIPLKDKLEELNNQLLLLQDAIKGTTSDAISASIVINGVETKLEPGITNNVYLPAWSIIADHNYVGSVSIVENHHASDTLSVKIKNTSDVPVRLFSVFPGPRDKFIRRWQSKEEVSESIVGKEGYGSFEEGAVEVGNKFEIFDKSGIKNYDESKNYQMMIYGPTIGDDDGKETKEKVWEFQRYNQFVYYRTNNPYDKDPFALCNWVESLSNPIEENNTIIYGSNKKNEGETGKNKPEISVWPITSSVYELCLEGDSVNNCKILQPGSEVTSNLSCEWQEPNWVIGNDPENQNERINYLETTLAFVVRNSLYSDPVYYEVKLIANQEPSDSELVNYAKYNAVTNKYNVTVN